MSMDRQLEMENGSNARKRDTDTLNEKESLYYIYTLCFSGMSRAFCFGTALTGWQAFVKILSKYIVQFTMSLVI